jgi:hypothetical protein
MKTLLALVASAAALAACTRAPSAPEPAAAAATPAATAIEVPVPPPAPPPPAPPPPPPPPPPFTKLFERPAWWGAVKAPVLATEADVDALWRSKPRCCAEEAKLQAAAREFDKGCFRLLATEAPEERAAVKCLWLMGAGLDRGESLRLREYLLARYSSHRASTHLCANCAPGDIVARVAGEVAGQRSGGHAEEGIRLLERVLDERRSDVSLWVQVELYTQLGRLYLASGITPARRQRLEEAFQRLGAARDDETLRTRFPAFEAVWREVAARG